MRPVFFMILFLVSGSFFSMKTEEEVITWSKDKKLTWADYRGKPQKRFAAASTVYSLGRKVLKEDKGALVARISAYFYCNDSWKKDDWISDEVLSHEQKHFDIVELFARKIRKQVSGMTVKNFDDATAKVDSVYQVFNKEMDAYQDKYDDETNGSMNGHQQRKWEKKIEKELESLDKYENIIVPLKTSGSR